MCRIREAQKLQKEVVDGSYLYRKHQLLSEDKSVALLSLPSIPLSRCEQVDKKTDILRLGSRAGFGVSDRFKGSYIVWGLELAKPLH